MRVVHLGEINQRKKKKLHKVERIIFGDYHIPEKGMEFCDCSVEQDGSVISWLHRHTLYVRAKNGKNILLAPEDCSQLLYGFDNVREIDLYTLDMRNVKSMNGMFSGLKKLERIQAYERLIQLKPDCKKENLFEGCVCLQKENIPKAFLIEPSEQENK